ncbi:hypothetical protein [Rheinheimera sp.]|uniref:hypothetical protein n=1 Tax=Rheinheimera sp. TaxID=1869214 RepID=UPI0027BA97ED|nr:hypothetical protein [Rheinheimera sp.]
MALSNAERQRNYRQRRQAEFVIAKTLRNERDDLMSEMTKLRNENNVLKQEIINLNKKISAMDMKLSTSMDAAPSTTEFPYEERLIPLRIPLKYQQIHTAALADEEFTRITPQLWVRSKGVANYKFAYRLVLLQTGNRYLLELRPALDRKSEEKLQSFITWQEMEDYIKERGL